MKFTDADKVLYTIQASDEAEFIRGENRARINRLFNAEPLLSADDAQKMKLKINVNFGEAAILGQHGRRQYQNAFLSRERYFRVSLPDAPSSKQLAWGNFITNRINRPLKRSRAYYELHRNTWATLLLHGIAPRHWYNKHSWRPCFVALDDFRVPTDTETSLENLVWFGVRKYYTEGELSRKVFGPNAAKGWKKEVIKPILEAYHDYQTAVTPYSWSNQPEKMAELIKQNGGYYASDAVPTIPLWHFFFLDDDDKWKMRVLPDQTSGILGSPQTEFLFDNGDDPAANRLDELAHVQFGDLNSKTPFMYHSVRSLGLLVMEPIFWDNLGDCRMLQHMFESMNPWIRVQNPQDKARAQKIELFDKAILPEGVSVVPQSERHQMDSNLFATAKAVLTRLKQQASASYTQDTEAGRKESETATAVMARVAAVNAMMSGLLNTAFNYERFCYEEICRRFCLSKTKDPDCETFQNECREFGIPRVFLNVNLWDVEPEIPLGDGNPTMEMAQSQVLMELRPMLDPTAQQEVLHEAVIVATNNPKKADRWVPIGKQMGVTDAQEHAELAFSTLMLGVPVRPKMGLNPIEQIETLIGLLAGVISRIERTGGMATMAEVVGLQNVNQYVQGLIQQLAQDKAQKPRVKEYLDALGKLMNAVKGFEQRLQQQSQNGNGDNGKLASQMMLAQTKAKISEAKAAQTQRQKETAFQAEQRRLDMKTVAEEHREHAKAGAEISRQRLKTFAVGDGE